MRVLSIQSSVAYGHAGNSAATFPLQRLGHDVYPVLTVHFSNHTGYGAWRGTVLDPAIVADVINGIEDRGAFADIDAVLTGYQGSPGVAEVVLDAVARVRAASPAAIYCCDPVLGDTDRGFFVLPGIPALMRDTVVPVADIVTPNVFELSYLAGDGSDPETATGADISTVPAILAAVARLREMGPRTVLVTSVEDAADPEHIGMIALDDTGAYQVTTPKLPISVNGLGDVTAAVFLARLGGGAPIERALAQTASAVFAVLSETVRQGSREIRLIDAQDAIAEPACEFEVHRID